MNMQFCSQPNFASAFSFAHAQGNDMQYPEDHYPAHSGFPGLQYMYGYHQPRGQMMTERNALGDSKAESKPRLSKEEVEKLERIFQENPKPSSSVKAQLADGLGLERPRINNWFQNRRAKAKQEKKQEEYEARRAAEKASSAPGSPKEIVPTAQLDYSNTKLELRTQPSSALFPGVNSSTRTSSSSCDQGEEADDYEEEDEEEEDVGTADGSVEFGSPDMHQNGSHDGDLSDGFQSPLSLDFSTGDPTMTTNHEFSQPRSMMAFHPFAASQQTGEQNENGHCRFMFSEDLPSPDEQGEVSELGHQFTNTLSHLFPGSSSSPIFRPQPMIETPVVVASPIEDTSIHDVLMRTPLSDSVESMSPGLPTPADSFKSPPPPANLASRRNIPRPATLQAASLRSRSYNLGGGPRTAMDGPRRADSSSPASAMRRIASATGNLSGRIQKCGGGPRSPLFFGRNPEVLLQQYHARSPMASVPSPFSGVAPPTPMTPVVSDQHSLREPTMSSSRSDDGSFMMLNGSVATTLMHEMKNEVNLKTPPSTPGLMSNFGAHGFPSNYNMGADFSSDQPLFTPFFHTEFPDLAIRNVPSYVELGDGGLPTTPLYPHTIGPMQGQLSFSGNTINNTQYDWAANESVSSSRSSPSQPRSKQIQFTQNMTPLDYSTQAHQER
ncbi:hypothetical protein F4778DRAFT_75892 [Xylariomycetidae sp. FL2044]|nr:hypothetical protein F4778DRAFT_75892 [Xylariomycetidae sp. FL2044]